MNTVTFKFDMGDEVYFYTEEDFIEKGIIEGVSYTKSIIIDFISESKHYLISTSDGLIS